MRQNTSRIKRAGLFGGVLLSLFAGLLLPDQFSMATGEVRELGWEARVTTGLAVLMAIWWMTEAIPVYATSLLPIALLPILGVAPTKTVCAKYADPLIFLVLGGFIIGLGLQTTGLHRRLALNTLRWVGTSATRIVAGFMAVTAGLSMWISNTASTMMMVPIAVSLVHLLESTIKSDERSDATPGSTDSQSKLSQQFATCLLLAIAYAASVGGMATLIGSPTNAFVASFAADSLSRPISFLEWMSYGVPVAVVLLPIVWIMLVRFLYPIRHVQLEGSVELIESEVDSLGKISQPEWTVLIVFVGTALCWVSRRWLVDWEIGGTTPFQYLSDGTIAIAGSLILFVAPREGLGLEDDRRVLDWSAMRNIPWGVLLLFGGGLSLANAIDQCGLSQFIGSTVVGMKGVATILIVLTVIALVVFLTEVTSNTATVTAIAPVLAALAVGLEIDPFVMLIPAGLAGSCAFMLPVATPPNAIVYGSERVPIGEMIRAGTFLNWISILILFAASTLLQFGK